MTREEQAALQRLHRRTSFMLSEARDHLFNCAVQSGDAEARQLTAAVVMALRALHEHTSEQLVALYSQGEEGEGD